MATQTSTHSGLGFCSQSRGEGGPFVDIVNNSKASISAEAEKVGNTKIYSQGRYECMRRTMEGRGEIRAKSK